VPDRLADPGRESPQRRSSQFLSHHPCRFHFGFGLGQTQDSLSVMILNAPPTAFCSLKSLQTGHATCSVSLPEPINLHVDHHIETVPNFLYEFCLTEHQQVSFGRHDTHTRRFNTTDALFPGPVLLHTDQRISNHWVLG